MRKNDPHGKLYERLLSLLPDLDDGKKKSIENILEETNRELKSQYISREEFTNSIDSFNDILLNYAQHNYGEQVEPIPDDDDLGSLAMSINLLGEELNHSTITKYYLSDIFSSMADMLIVIDNLGYIDSVNSATISELGYEKDELIYKNVNLILEEKYTAEFFEEINKKGTVSFITKNGKNLPVSISTAPFVRGDNKKIGTILIARDLTVMISYQKEIEESNRKITKANEDLIVAIKRIEESDKLKTAFLQNISHEIRTPLNAIIGFTRLLNIDDLSKEKHKQYCSYMEKSGDRLIEIVNNILDISKIETGQYNLSPDFFDVNKLLVELSEIYTNEATAKDLKISFHTPAKNQKTIIFADEYMVNQVLTNLIKNAIKFTNEGEITYGFIVKGDYIEFYVKDTGIGIAPENYSLIFDRFTQEDIKLSRNYQGAGLGLSISKGLVELLGGKIWVESVLKKGTTFYFTIPFHPQELYPDNDIKNNNTNNDEHLIVKSKILICEDEDLNFLYLDKILSSKGHEIHRALNVKEAIEKSKSIYDIDLILMDFKMPSMNGIETTKKIKELKPNIPIFAITAFAFIEDKKQILNAGFDDYLPKPVYLKNIYKAILKHQKLN